MPWPHFTPSKIQLHERDAARTDVAWQMGFRVDLRSKEALRIPLQSLARSGPMRAGRHVLSQLLRRYPFKVGFERVGLAKILAPFAMGSSHAIARLRNGASLIVFTREHVGRIILYMGDLDPRISHVVRRVLRPGDTVLDIGANVGWLSMVAAPLVGPAGRVHSFEPQRQLHTVLAASVMLNGFGQVTVHPFGLSDVDGQARLFVRDGNLGMATLDPQIGEGWSETVIHLREANAVLASLEIPHIRLMKLDVEGHEVTILKAAASFLDGVQPDVILFESNRDPKPLAEREILAILFTRGYRIFGFSRKVFRVQLIEQKQGAASIPESNDYVALREGPDLAADLTKLGLATA